MLKKERRLTSKEVEEVLKGGRSVRSEHLQVKLLQAPVPLRSAAVAPKSVGRKAVERNSLRRALYLAIAATDTHGLHGYAVFFVRAVPKGKLTPTFTAELATLLPSIRAKLTQH